MPMTLAAAWNADTQLDAREPGRVHLERGRAQKRISDSSDHDLTVRR